MSETARIEFVRDYVRRISALQRLDADINRLYVDPKTPDPALASADMRAQRDRARADLVARQELPSPSSRSRSKVRCATRGLRWAARSCRRCVSR